MAGAWRKARALALQALYEVDAVGHEVEEVVTRLLAEGGLSEENASLFVFSFSYKPLASTFGEPF